eukprot:COSAG02_NODE_4283_length_5550_cov_3.230050_5_plen_145_part_00
MYCDRHDRPLLELFLHSGVYIFTILDDSEVYEKQYPFTLAQLKEIALFCNQLGFQMMWSASAAGARGDEVLKPLCTRLLAVLFERDSRQAFTSPEDWFVADRRLAKEFDKEVMQESARALNVRVVSTTLRVLGLAVCCYSPTAQ